MSTFAPQPDNGVLDTHPAVRSRLSAYYSDDTVTLHHGDCLDVLRALPDASVDAVVTSPPYYGLRDYGNDGQYGLEASPADYVENLRALFAEVRRVLADDGTCWLNLGDSYASQPGWGRGGSSHLQGRKHSRERDNVRHERAVPPLKNLFGIPWRVAFALQDDGWILRNEVIWSKPNAMPESVTDRLSTRHEHLFLLTKSPRYWFDLDPIREPVVSEREAALTWARDSKEADVPGQSMRQHRAGRAGATPPHSTPQSNFGPIGTRNGRFHESGKNPGDVWTVATQPFPGAHFACMPPELARRAVVAGCKPGGVVLDPFSGSGTTGMVAQQNGRRYVGIDLNADYLDLSLRTRLNQGVLDIADAR